MSKEEGQISRVCRSKDAVKANYDRLSSWYDLLAGWSERKVVKYGLKQLDLHAGDTVLEIGYGTGRSIVALGHAVGPLGHVLGIDISEGMRRVADARVRKARLAGRVTLICGDATLLAAELEMKAALSRSPSSSKGLPDAIFMSFTLELFDVTEIPVVLRECRSVLRHDGQIVVVAMQKKATRNAITRLYERAHKTIPNVVDCRPILVDQVLADAGFDVTQKHEMRLWGLPVLVAVATNSSARE